MPARTCSSVCQCRPATAGQEGEKPVSLIVLVLIAVVASFPATWLLMLFLGNVGVLVGFCGALPGGILLTFFVAGAGAGARRRPSWS